MKNRNTQAIPARKKAICFKMYTKEEKREEVRNRACFMVLVRNVFKIIWNHGAIGEQYLVHLEEIKKMVNKEQKRVEKLLNTKKGEQK